MALKKNAMRATADNCDEDLFAGLYERFKPKYFYGNKNYANSKTLPSENFNSEIIPQRKELFKNVIWRKKREFEAPIVNLFQDKMQMKNKLLVIMKLKELNLQMNILYKKDHILKWVFKV